MQISYFILYFNDMLKRKFEEYKLIHLFTYTVQRSFTILCAQFPLLKSVSICLIKEEVFVTKIISTEFSRIKTSSLIN